MRVKLREAQGDALLAMVLNPIVARSRELDPRLSGIFLGAPIPDVARVIGAGYSVKSTIALARGLPKRPTSDANR